MFAEKCGGKNWTQMPETDTSFAFFSFFLLNDFVLK
jgi:hypothetical protein